MFIRRVDGLGVLKASESSNGVVGGLKADVAAAAALTSPSTGSFDGDSLKQWTFDSVTVNDCGVLACEPADAAL